VSWSLQLALLWAGNAINITAAAPTSSSILSHFVIASSRGLAA
jgi:hypothetical protein